MDRAGLVGFLAGVASIGILALLFAALHKWQLRAHLGRLAGATAISEADVRCDPADVTVGWEAEAGYAACIGPLCATAVI